ncbi:MAG: T9SS type A sorting domain-containing protein [Bacteroidales bacterium]|nr:T9SS type A sorting domain-containing protein [Bacteroidales bacterium]
MRFKNFTLLFLLGIFGLFTTNLFAQQDATIDPADIRYWIGEGENEVVFIVNWNEPDTALAWGYRFNGESVTVETMMDDIAAADYRFSYNGANNWLNDIYFNDGVLDLSLAGMWWMYIVSGEMAGLGYSQQTVVNGDYVKWGDESCGNMIDPENYGYIWEKEVAAVYPLADEAKIDPAEILYWIGEGENEVVFAVNWNEPNKCLAWGYRFSEDAITVEAVMDAIAEVDRRFAYEGSNGWLSDITFNDGELNLALAGMYFIYNVNGVGAWLGYNEQTVANGDFIKWGDESCGTEIAPWTYVWTQEVEPVSVYTGMDDNEVSNLSVYPNPAVNETFVTLENAGLNEVSVYDMQGRMVSTMNCVANAGEQVRLSTEMMASGVYFVRVSNDGAVSTAKLVVK